MGFSQPLHRSEEDPRLWWEHSCCHLDFSLWDSERRVQLSWAQTPDPQVPGDKKCLLLYIRKFVLTRYPAIDAIGSSSYSLFRIICLPSTHLSSLSLSLYHYLSNIYQSIFPSLYLSLIYFSICLSAICLSLVWFLARVLVIYCLFFGYILRLKDESHDLSPSSGLFQAARSLFLSDVDLGSSRSFFGWCCLFVFSWAALEAYGDS